jgi:hypothetical protein
VLEFNSGVVTAAPFVIELTGREFSLTTNRKIWLTILIIHNKIKKITNFRNTVTGSIKECLLFRELSAGERQSIKSPTRPRVVRLMCKS